MSLANHPNALSGGASPTTGVIAGGTLVGLNGQTIVGNASGSWVITANGTAQAVDIADSTGQNARFTNKHLLLGGLITDGTGVLQFPAAITSAGGVTLGADVNIFRNAAGELAISNPSGSMVVGFYHAGARAAYIQTNGANTVTFNAGNVLILGTLGGTDIQIDASHNVALAGSIRAGNFATASAPAYAKGVIYFDTTLNKLRVGGATAFETITSV